MDKNIDQQLASIKLKLQQLLKQYQLLQKENDRLKKELEKATSNFETKTHQLQNIQQQANVLQFGTQDLDANEKAALAKRIDSYLKEIEQCINLLNP
jgi:predicted nuclease with TOPRIM domain